MKIRLPQELLQIQAVNTKEEDCMNFSSPPVFPTRRQEGGVNRGPEIRPYAGHLVPA